MDRQRRPVPKSRTRFFSNDGGAGRPVPRPRESLESREPPSCSDGGAAAPAHAPPEPAPPVAAPRRRTEQQNFTEWVNDAKRLSKDLAISTRDKIEKGVLIGANLARDMLEQKSPQKKNVTIEEQQPLPDTKSQNASRPISVSDMCLIESIQFNSPKSDDVDKLTNCDKNSVHSDDSANRRHDKEDVNNLSDMYAKIIKRNDTKVSKTRPSESTILEFDPLLHGERSNDDCNDFNQLLLVESLLSEPYKCLQGIDDDLSSETDFEFYVDNMENAAMPPPKPPLRYDSLQNCSEVGAIKPTPRERSSFVESFKSSNMKLKKTLSLMVKNTSTNNIKKKIEEKLNGKQQKLDRPPPLPYRMIHHEGMMTRLLSGAIDELFKKFPERLCVLTNATLTCYADNTVTTAKETYNMENLCSIQTIFSNNLESEIQLHCFKLTFQNASILVNGRMSVIFGCATKVEREQWIAKLVECLTDKFETNLINELTRIGWCHVKENISSTWELGWLLLSHRYLYYHTMNDSEIHQLDLRKARCVVLQEDNDATADNKTNLIIDLPHRTVYFKMGHNEETKVWRKIIYNISTSNGKWLYRQQLTKDDVPTLVEKCINFIYAHGSLTEHIYRRAGSNTMVSSLLEEFKKDAWSVQLSPRTHTEHDVATALKRFFRDLPEPVLSKNVYQALCDVSDMREKEKKIDTYRTLLSELHPINQNTLRKLFGHLHFVSSLSEFNHMTSANLAAVWSPTLLRMETNSVNVCAKESQVIRDLIDLYVSIYKPSKEEFERDNLMRTILHKYLNKSLIPSKPSGDFHIWVYLKYKSSDNAKNVILKPNTTAKDLCSQFSNELNTKIHDLVVEENIGGDAMRRPLHHSEIVLDVVIKWSYWDEDDRRENFLLIYDNEYYKQTLLLKNVSEKDSYTLGELRYANGKTRTFKTCFFILGQADLYCYKDKFYSDLLESWKLKDIIWYLGNENKRNPNPVWSITMIPKRQKTIRSKTSPHFGTIITGRNKNDCLVFIGNLLLRCSDGDFFPQTNIIDL